ncbi:MAG: preprotein translocase subunit SecG [Verrucomicrobia bacterium]|nr:MAG: preprotein translocase subunit SecG [Verrucomicrobiota bacterium]
MQQLFINLLTLVLVVVALFLGLLILLQLPKKEAGITAAFGAESTAALFGAGSGTALSSITRWSAGIFLGLCFLIAILTANESRSKAGGKIRDALKTTAAAAGIPASGNIPATAVASNVVAVVSNAVAPLKVVTNAPRK